VYVRLIVKVKVSETNLAKQRKDVVNALHASAHSEAWIECRSPLHSAFRERTENASITIIPKVLAKIPILIFAGDQDLICNYVGLEAMIKEMTWNGATGLGVLSDNQDHSPLFDEIWW